KRKAAGSPCARCSRARRPSTGRGSRLGRGVPRSRPWRGARDSTAHWRQRCSRVRGARGAAAPRAGWPAPPERGRRRSALPAGSGQLSTALWALCVLGTEAGREAYEIFLDHWQDVEERVALAILTRASDARALPRIVAWAHEKNVVDL